MDVHEVATRRTNKTFIQNKTIILKLECTINNESIYSLTDYVKCKGVIHQNRFEQKPKGFIKTKKIVIVF